MLLGNSNVIPANVDPVAGAITAMIDRESALNLVKLPVAKVVTLCGSSRFVDIMAVCAWLMERDERVITMGLHFLPRWYCGGDRHHIAESEGVAMAMDELHLRKIDLSDEIFVVNWSDCIGNSTRREIEYAKEHDKPIRWFTHDPIGRRVKALMTEFDHDK